MPFAVQRYEEIDTELQRIQEYLAKLLTEMQVNEPDPKMRDSAYWSLLQTAGAVKVLRAQFRTRRERRRPQP